MTSLIVLRHGKAAPPAAGGDHHRPLEERGRLAAGLVGARLKEMGIQPDIVLVSSALRTRETYQHVAAALTLPEPLIEDELYLASAQVLLRRLKKIPQRTKCVLIIGHNPGLAELVQRTADPGESDAEGLQRARTRFPTAACAVLTVLTPWSEIQDGDCGLLSYFTPGDLGGTNEE